MRLDKFLSETGTATRSESKKAARFGGVTLNGVTVRDLSVHIDPENDHVTYMGNPIVYQKNIYIMMNKPDGVISATEDGNEKTVLELLPEKYRKMEIFPCGRLDKNTLGLLILTNNGALAHRLLSPKCHVEKTYRFECERPLTDSDVELLCKGVDIGEKSSTQPAPPEAMTGTLTTSHTACSISRSKPPFTPSVSMELSTISPAPRSTQRLIQLMASMPVFSRPPLA